MKKVEMPKMGDTMEEGKILRWIKKEGDPVKKGESLAEVETDKVNIEIEAYATGVLRKILIAEGASASIGATIAIIGSPDESLPEDIVGTSNESHTEPVVSVVGYSSISANNIGAGAGVMNHAPAQAANDVGNGRDSSLPGANRIFISPLARRLAQEHRLNYSQIRGTGPNGRIIRLDIEAALIQQKQAAQPSIAASEPEFIPTGQAQSPGYISSLPPVPTSVAPGTDEFVEVPLTAMRRTIAKRLSQSMQTAPHFYMTSVIDTGKLAALRQQINAYAAGEPVPVKVSFNDLIIKAVARALVRMPQVNVSFAEDRILQKKQVHIGVAVALEQGLIVPVLRNADRLGILDIARETQQLAEAARNGTLRPENFSGGTFTVSNLGMFDVDSFTAIINPPESAILAVGSITPTPVVVDDQVVVRDRMKVTLSSDHRAIDGAIAARFLQEIKRLLEEPLGVLL
jgi:pyruvate dehydrogenase E2 component (dihydrolipoamide acetyltransferase)